MSDSRAEIMRCWRRQVIAMDEADTAALRSCFTDDAVLVHLTGHVQPVDDWMAGIERGEFVYHQVIVESEHLELTDGGTARLTADVITGYRADGSGQAWPLHLVQDYEPRPDGWRCARSRVTLR